MRICKLLLGHDGAPWLSRSRFSFWNPGLPALGFWWNWPNAHIFMGDAGSCFLGFSIGALMLLGVVRGELGGWVVPILLGVFVVDATLTLCTRIVRGEQWYKPHRLHAFCHAADVFGHRNVTVAVIMINLVWLAPLAMLAEIYPAYGLAFLLLAWFPLVVLCYLFHSGEVLIAGGIPRWRTVALIAHCTPKGLWGRLSNYAEKRKDEQMSWVRSFLIVCISVVSTYVAIPPPGSWDSSNAAWASVLPRTIQPRPDQHDPGLWPATLPLAPDLS